MAPITKVGTPSGLGLGNAPGVMVSIDWSPTPVVLAAMYETLAVNVKSFREPLKRSVQQVLSPSIRRNFDVGGRPPWQALSSVTKEIRVREGFSEGPILVRTGKLKRVAGQLNIWTIDSEKAFVSNLGAASYGIVHQEGAAFTGRGGGGSKKKNMQKRVTVHPLTMERTVTMVEIKKPTTGGGGSIPARPFLLIQDDDVAQVDRVFGEWLRERVAAAGFRPGSAI